MERTMSGLYVCKLGSTYRWPKSVGRDLPAALEDGEVCESNTRSLGLGREDGEDGWVEVVLGDAADDDESVGVVLVGDIAIQSNESYNTAIELESAYFPCQATTSKGVCSCVQTKSWPPSL